MVIEKFRIVGDARSGRPVFPLSPLVHVSVEIIGHLDEQDSIDTLGERPEAFHSWQARGPQSRPWDRFAGNGSLNNYSNNCLIINILQVLIKVLLNVAGGGLRPLPLAQLAL